MYWAQARSPGGDGMTTSCPYENVNCSIILWRIGEYPCMSQQRQGQAQDLPLRENQGGHKTSPYALPGFSNGNDLNAHGNANKPARSWWRRRPVIIGIVLLLLAVLIGGFVFSKFATTSPPTYQYQAVTQ